MQRVFQVRMQTTFAVAIFAVVAFSLQAVAQGPMSPFAEGVMPRVGNMVSTNQNVLVSANQNVPMEQPNLSSVDMWYQLAELNSLVNQPVSYTHLDVYKRQTSNRELRNAQLVG